MKKNNNKGMSLIEIIVSILIISIASMILLESFFAITNLIGNSNRYDLATDEQLASLVGGMTNNTITLTTEQKETIIMVEGATEPISVMGEYVVANGIDKDISLKNFITLKKDTDSYQETLVQLQEIYNETKDMTAERKNEYLSSLEQKTGIATGLTCLTGARNDELRVFYYLQYGHREIEKEVIEECNKVYDMMHPTPIPGLHEAKAKIGERRMYLKPYFIEATKEFILCGGFVDDFAQEGWKTNIIYDQIDMCFYYKVFPATSTGSNQESDYVLTKTTSLMELRTELHGTGWQKITAK